jgi:tetratricopeptide (TPR) repeat protein
VQHELAKSFRVRIRGRRADNVDQAIHHYQQALEVYTRQADPMVWAGIQYNLAVATQNRVEGDREAHITAATAIYQQVLEVYRPNTDPVRCRLAGFNLGKLGFDLRNWDLVIEGYGAALAAQEILFPSISSRSRKESMLRETHDTPACLAYALAKKGCYQEAVETVERGRAQLLREGLARNRKDLSALPGLGFEQLHARYSAALAAYGDLVQMGQREVRPSGWRVALEAAQGETAAIEKEIREQVGKSYPEFRYFNQPLPFAVI